MCLVCVVLLVRCRKMYCFAPGARTKPSTAIMACAVLGNALFYAWSKNTAGNSNYGLRGAGKCVFTAGVRTQPATAITTLAVLENTLFCAWSKNTAGNSNYDLRGAGECVILRLEQEHSQQQQLRLARYWRMLFGAYTKFERMQLRIERAVLENVVWCPKRDLNPHSCNSQRILSPSCLPIPPSGQKLLYLKRGNQ